jgi:putative mRNA 3-end processing factor
MTLLIVYTPSGLYCPAGDFYIDPCRSVPHAIITHAHGDHLYRGSQHYYCSHASLALVKCRLSKKAHIQSFGYGDPFKMGDASVSFHPAGHILGSSQIRIEAHHQVWVISGDYKRTPDPSCEVFEVVPCDVFITETTFARPCYQWGPTDEVMDEVWAWWQQNNRTGQASLLYCYALGKAQRILAELVSRTDKQVWVHPSFEPLISCYREAGIRMSPTQVVSEESVLAGSFAGELILTPPWTMKKGWQEHFSPYETAFTSGWMQGQQSRYWGWQYDQGFVLSDHADWNELLQTILETGAQRVYTMPGSGRLLSQHLKQEFGIVAKPVTQLKDTGVYCPQLL